MILSIIIPHYNECESQVFPLLSSINFQKGLDLSQIEVIIVNDCGSPLSSDFLELFTDLNMQTLSCNTNKGPGVARQKGLDNANGKYVMFCDCDDMLYSVAVLTPMLTEMENNELEMLSTDWVEQIGLNEFVTHSIEQTWLHGKMFLREFLNECNIKFHDELRVHEDTYFLKLVANLCIKRQHFNMISYLWNYNANSITRCDNAIYGFECMPEFIFAVVEATKKLQCDYEQHVCQLVIYIYLLSQSPIWLEDEVADYRIKMLQALHDNLSNMWQYWDDATDELKQEIYANESIKCMPQISLDEFVSEVMINAYYIG